MKPGGSVSKVAPKHLCNQPFNCTTSPTLLSTLSSKLRDTVVLLPLNYAYNLWKGQLPFMVGTNSAVQKLPVLHGCALHTCADICATHTTKITRTPHGNHAQTEGEAAAAKGRRRSWWLELRSGSERSTPGPCGWCSSNGGISVDSTILGSHGNQIWGPPVAGVSTPRMNLESQVKAQRFKIQTAVFTISVTVNPNDKL